MINVALCGAALTILQKIYICGMNEASASANGVSFGTADKISQHFGIALQNVFYLHKLTT